MLDPNTRERELKPLRSIIDSFPKYAITLDRFGIGTTDDGIQILNAIDWPLGRPAHALPWFESLAPQTNNTVSK